MKLSENQIAELYHFTKSKGIAFIDLQEQIVEHLSQDIELQLSSDCTLSFTKALSIVYNKFGVFGLDGLLMERKTKMEKKVVKLIFSIFLSFFRIRWIIFNTAVFFIFEYLSSFFSSAEVFYYCFGISVFATIIYINYIEFRGLRELRTLYFEAQQFQLINQNLILLFYLVLSIPVFISHDILSTYSSLISFNLTFMVLLSLSSRTLLIHLKSNFSKMRLVSFDK